MASQELRSARISPYAGAMPRRELCLSTNNASPIVMPPQELCFARSPASAIFMPRQELCLPRSYASPRIMPSLKLCFAQSYASPTALPGQQLWIPSSCASPRVMPTHLRTKSCGPHMRTMVVGLQPLYASGLFLIHSLIHSSFLQCTYNGGCPRGLEKRMGAEWWLSPGLQPLYAGELRERERHRPATRNLTVLRRRRRAARPFFLIRPAQDRKSVV